MSTLLKLKKINLKYQTGKDTISVLKNIDLNIKKKETVSVVGESGSGKTSLIMLIGGLEKPNSGKIIFNDREITGLSEDEVSEIRKKNIGIIFQSFYLIPNYTAVENVALTLELNNFKNPEKEAKILFEYVKEEGSSLIMVTHDTKLADKAKKKINLKYQTGKDNISVLKNIDLNIKKKETVSVVGESGSGKTSLIMLIGGLEKPTSGKIIFNDREISGLSEDEVSEIRKKNIGIIFQSFYLIPNYPAVENVALTLELNNFKNPEKEAKILLDRFGLKHRFNNLPSQLSGGEQQRVAIARAIAMKPELILADEPTGNLDTENSIMIANILFKYVKEEGSSLIMVTHDPKLADKAKRKIKIKDGKIK